MSDPSSVRPIPKRIIQTGKTRRLTLTEEAAVASVRALNPGFEYVYFDDADIGSFIADRFPQYKEAFDAFPFNIQRIDFFRYLAIYELGGFYFDLDVFLARSIEDLTNKSCVFPFEELTINPYLRDTIGIDWEIGNYAFGASAGHPFLHAIIKNCIRSQKDRQWTEEILAGIPRLFRSSFKVLVTTGPAMVTRTLAETSIDGPPVTILFPEDVYDPRSSHTFGTYGVHLMAASWRDKGSFLRRKLTLQWEASRRRDIAAERPERGPSRSWPNAEF